MFSTRAAAQVYVIVTLFLEFAPVIVCDVQTAGKMKE